MTMPKGKKSAARTVVGDNKDANSFSDEQSTGDHGMKFTNAGSAGDEKVAAKFNMVGKLNVGKATAVNLKGG